MYLKFVTLHKVQGTILGIFLLDKYLKSCYNKFVLKQVQIHKNGDDNMKKMNFDVLHSNIEAERARKGWTIQQTADKLGINERTYRKRLANAQDIPASVLYDIAVLFGVSADYLVGLSDKINRV